MLIGAFTLGVRLMPKAKEPCWVCRKPPAKYAVSHHVMGAKVDPDLTVDLCRGCHMLEKYLAQRKFLKSLKAVGRLITLARFHAGLPDARTFVYFETDTTKAKKLKQLTAVVKRADIAAKIYELVYPHTQNISEKEDTGNG